MFYRGKNTNYRAGCTFDALQLGASLFGKQKPLISQWFVVRSDVLLSQGVPPTTINAFLDLR